MEQPIEPALSEISGRHAPGSIAELMRVALPLIISSGSQSVMYVTDRMFLTWYSQESLAAVLPAGMLNWALISLAFGTCQYANTFVAQYEGAKRPDRVAASVWQGIYLAIAAGSIYMLASIWSEPLFRWIGHDSAVIPHEVAYFEILSLGAIAPILAVVLSCFFSGRGQTMVVMWANVAGALTNVVFDYMMIFGKGPFPEMGIRGAAIATVLGSIASAVFYAVLMFRKPARDQYGTWRHRAFDLDLFRRFLRFGLPSGLHFFADLAGFAVFMLLIGRIGKTELAATNLAFNLNALAFIPMLGMGIAVSTLVGQRIGEGRAELGVRTAWLAFGLCGAYMLVFAIIYVVFPDLILQPYLAHAREDLSGLRDLIVLLLRFVAIYSFFDAMAIVFGSAIRGAGDTRFAFYYSFATGWLLMVVPTYFICQWSANGLLQSWWACTVYVIVLGIGFLLRFMAGHWKTMSVIESAGEAVTVEPKLVLNAAHPERVATATEGEFS